MQARKISSVRAAGKGANCEQIEKESAARAACANAHTAGATGKHTAHAAATGEKISCATETAATTEGEGYAQAAAKHGAGCGLKSTLTRLTAFFCAFLLLFTASGCKGSKENIDAEATLALLLKDVKYSSKLREIKENADIYFSELPEGTEIKLYKAAGYSADEAVLITVDDSKKLKAAKKAAEKHVDELRKQFADYRPEEVGKIDRALLYSYGTYIFLCVSDDSASAEKILKDPVKGSAKESKSKAKTTAKAKKKKQKPVKAAAVSGKYPKIKSASGEFVEYGKNSYTFRVDGRAFTRYSYVESAASNYAGVINSVADALKGKADVYCLVIPTAIGITLPDDIAPKISANMNQGEACERIFAKLNSNVKPVRCYDNLMKHRTEYLYFNTDYHWNGRGAYYAYEAFCAAKGVKKIPLSERELKQFGGFLGTLYQKNSKKDPVLREHPDTVEAYLPKSKSASMEFSDSKGNWLKWPIIMDVSSWPEGTKYSAFAAADNPLAVFKNPELAKGPVCVIVKESFGNALLPLLVDHYSLIYEIDYRHWDGNLIDFAKEKGAKDVIFANNLEMISTNLLVGELAECCR